MKFQTFFCSIETAYEYVLLIRLLLEKYKKGDRQEDMRQNSEPWVQDARSLGFEFDPHGQATACRVLGVVAVFSVCLSSPRYTAGQRIKRRQGDARLAREATRRSWRVVGDPRWPDPQSDFRTCQWPFCFCVSMSLACRVNYSGTP